MSPNYPYHAPGLSDLVSRVKGRLGKGGNIGNDLKRTIRYASSGRKR